MLPITLLFTNQLRTTRSAVFIYLMHFLLSKDPFIQFFFLLIHKNMFCGYPLDASWEVLLGPVVQSVVSLTSLLRVISLTVLMDSIYNILIFFAEKM